MTRIICVYGSPGSGKSVLSAKLAMRAEREGDGRVALVLTDPYTPMLPVFFPDTKNERFVSLGSVLSRGTLSAGDLMGSLFARKAHPDLGVAGYVLGDYPRLYPEITPKMCEGYFNLLEEFVDTVILDLSSALLEPLTAYALKISDVQVSLATPTLGSMAYYKSAVKAIAKEGLGGRKRIAVLNHPDEEVALPREEAAREGMQASFVLPHEKLLKVQLAEGRLWEGGESRSFKGTLDGILKEAMA